jgi:hypothetical protein
LAVAFRIAQSAEFIPATFAQQLLPGIRDNLPKSRSRLGSFAALGAIVAVGIWLFRDLLAIVVVFPPGTEFILFILILSLPFKFANHYLISLTMAVDLLAQRTAVTSVLAVIVIAIGVMVSLTVGTAIVVAVLAAAVEVALALCLLVLVQRKSNALALA